MAAKKKATPAGKARTEVSLSGGGGQGGSGSDLKGGAGPGGDTKGKKPAAKKKK